MQTYLDVARDIHSWLAALQIKQKWIEADFIDGQLVFDLIHPSQGKIKVRQALPPEKVFRCEGVALELGEPNRFHMKLRVYDYGGIWDPIDGHVPGEHYATTHFALLSAILFLATKESRYIEQAIEAIAFHLYTSPDTYALSNWMYHWDFQNYAFVATYDLLKPYLPAKVKDAWLIGIKTWQTNHRNKLANWAAMRALAHLHRRKAVGGLSEFFKYHWNARAVSQARQVDGCIDDHKNISRPIQYHIFAAALLHRIFLLNDSKRMLRWFMAGVDYLLPWIDPDGDFNYWGRGQEQIFGYGAAIYSLQAAAQSHGNRQKYQNAADALLRYLVQFKNEDHFPLVLNARRDDELYGWYDYHHTTVYNAFLGVWLGFTHTLRWSDSDARRSHVASSKNIDVTNVRGAKPETEASSRATTYLKSTQFVFLENENFYCAIGAGLKAYLSEAGLSPCHVWMRDAGWLFSCPGGPTPDTFGKVRNHPGAQENFLAPLAILPEGQLINAAAGVARFTTVTDDQVIVQWQNRHYAVLRKISLLPRSIHIDDEISFARAADYREFRFMSFPVVTDKFDIGFEEEALVLTTRDGVRVKIETHNDFGVASFRTNPRIKTAKGDAQVIRQCVIDFHAEPGMVRHASMMIMPTSSVVKRRAEEATLGNSIQG